MNISRTATASWDGDLKEGNGRMSFESGAFEGPYTFASRFEQGKGENSEGGAAQKTNPEELIGAAHAGCFSMALSGDLGRAGYSPESIETTATVHLEKVDDRPTVTRIHLVTKASVPEIGDEEFQKIVEGTKDNCPISRLLKAADITVDAELSGQN